MDTRRSLHGAEHKAQQCQCCAKAHRVGICQTYQLTRPAIWPSSTSHTAGESPCAMSPLVAAAGVDAARTADRGPSLVGMTLSCRCFAHSPTQAPRGPRSPLRSMSSLEAQCGSLAARTSTVRVWSAPPAASFSKAARCSNDEALCSRQTNKLVSDHPVLSYVTSTACSATAIGDDSLRRKGGRH